MRMLEETGKISNERNMEELLDKDAPHLNPRMKNNSFQKTSSLNNSFGYLCPR